MESSCLKQNPKIPSDTTQFSDLPPEIIEKIFIYSCSPDVEKSQNCIKSISLVCRKWLEITNSPTIHRNYFVLCLRMNDITNNPEEIFCNSIRNFYNLNVKRINFANDSCKENFIKLLELDNFSKIETLTTWKCIMDYDFLCKIIQKFENLKELKIEGCRFPKEFTNIEENCQRISNIIKQLIELQYLDNVDQCNLKFFNEFINYTKNLEYFKVEEYAVYDEQTLYTNELSAAIYKLAKNNYKTLKKLNFLLTLNSHKKFLTKYDLKSLKLQLHCLTMENVTSTLNLREILLINSNINDLELLFSHHEEGDRFDFTIIVENLKKLKSLKMSYGMLKNLNLFTLSQLENLTKLVLKGLNFDFTTTNPVQQIEKLKYFEICESSVSFDEVTLNMLTERLINLKHFFIRSEQTTQDEIQSIIRNLPKLTYLTMEQCRISNYAISGFNEETGVQEGVSIQNFNNLEKLKISAKLLGDVTVAKNFKFPNLKMLHTVDEDITDQTIIEIIRNCPLLHLFIVSTKFDWQKCNEELIKFEKTITYDKEESHLEHHRYKIENC